MQPNRPVQETPQQTFERAHRLLALGDTHEAGQLAGMLRHHFPRETPIKALNGIVLATMGLHEAAIADLTLAADETAEALQDRADDNPARPRIANQLLQLCVHLAQAHAALGDQDQADAALARAAEVDPEDGHLIRAQVAILAQRGDQDQARAILDQAVQDDLEELFAASAAADLTLARADAPAAECRMLAGRLHALTEQSGHTAATHADLIRNAANLYHRAGDHDEAFRTFIRAANLKRGSFDAAIHAKIANATIATSTPEALAKPSKPEATPAVDPARIVFVFGAPHAGGIELARSLAHHPSIASMGTSEALTAFAVRHADATQTQLRPVIKDPGKLRRTQLEAVADAFTKQLIATARPNGRDPATTIYLDASHAHTEMLGLAALALPGATFLFVSRDPRSTLLASYFGTGPGQTGYSKELATTAAYLRDHARLTEHWQSVLPDLGARVLTTSYEALQSDPDAETARIVAALGLEPHAVPAPRFAHTAADDPDHYTKRIEPVASLLSQPTPTA